jgi:Putative addiction module component
MRSTAPSAPGSTQSSNRGSCGDLAASDRRARRFGTQMLLLQTAQATLLAMATRAQLVEALLEFPAPDRAEAARALLESLDGEDDPIDVDAAWRAEIANRVQEIESGAVELEDGPAAMGRLRDRAQARLERRGS